MIERRQFDRMPLDKLIDFSVCVLEFRQVKTLHLKGKTLDISNGGACIQTDYPIEPGYLLRFCNDIGHEVGLVKWSTSINSNAYRCGIRFSQHWKEDICSRAQ